MPALSRREYDEMKKHNPFKRKQNADAISIANLFSLVKQYVIIIEYDMHFNVC
ncbi:MAG: hypothetical protein ACI4G1_04840 [Ruminococcus sp.]